MDEENTVISSREGHYLQVLSTQVNVCTYAIHIPGLVLAKAPANLNGCFTIRGLRAVDVGDGPFISMPGYQADGGYRNTCFPSKREFRQQFRQAVLDAYGQALCQLPQRQREYQAESTQNDESM